MEKPGEIRGVRSIKSRRSIDGPDGVSSQERQQTEVGNGMHKI